LCQAFPLTIQSAWYIVLIEFLARTLIEIVSEFALSTQTDIGSIDARIRRYIVSSYRWRLKEARGKA